MDPSSAMTTHGPKNMNLKIYCGPNKCVDFEKKYVDLLVCHPLFLSGPFVVEIVNHCSKQNGSK